MTLSVNERGKKETFLPLSSTLK